MTKYVKKYNNYLKTKWKSGIKMTIPNCLINLKSTKKTHLSTLQ